MKGMNSWNSWEALLKSQRQASLTETCFHFHRKSPCARVPSLTSSPPRTDAQTEGARSQLGREGEAVHPPGTGSGSGTAPSQHSDPLWVKRKYSASFTSYTSNFPQRFPETWLTARNSNPVGGKKKNKKTIRHHFCLVGPAVREARSRRAGQRRGRPRSARARPARPRPLSSRQCEARAPETSSLGHC